MLLLWTKKIFKVPVNNNRSVNVNKVSGLEINKGEFAMLNVERKNLGTVSLLSLDGKVVIGETAPLRDVVQTLPPASFVILDLSHVTLVDAHGLGVFLRVREQAQARGMAFELANVSNHLRELFRITRLDSVFKINSAMEFLRFAPRRTSMAA